MIPIFLYFILGFAALLMGILAWRLKEQVYFIIGWILIGLMGVMAVVYWRFVEFMIRDVNIFLIVILGSLLGFPIYFLIQSKLGNKNTGGSSNIDGSTAGGAVTEEYLDEIINSADEDIDFEEDLDLK